MPQSESTGLYKTIFYMPVIAPLPSGVPADPDAPAPPFTDPNSDYPTLINDPGFSVTEDSDLALKVALPGTTAPVLLSTSGGFISFVPKGESYLLPDETPLAFDDTDVPAGAGTLVLQTWLEDYSTLSLDAQVGEQAMQYVLYQSVNKDSVKSRLAPFVKALPKLLLTKGSGLSPDSATPAQMSDAYLERLVEGKTSLFVRGGTPLGEIEPLPGVTGSGQEIVLQSRDDTGAELTLLPFLLAMQGRDTAWLGHPLVQAAELVASKKPIAWYLEFRQATSGAHLPINGALVRLMCKKKNSQEEELHQQPTDATGNVLFEFDTYREFYNVPATMSEKDGQDYMLERNQIFFIVHTPSYDWSTWGWNDANGLPAYYISTPPPKVGKENKPRIIHVGLDYHIVFRYQNRSRLIPALGLNDEKTSLEPAPEGIPVEMFASEKSVATHETGATGEIHGVLFNIEPDKNISFKLTFDIQGANSADTLKVIDKDGSTPATDRVYDWDSSKVGGGTLANYKNTSIPFNPPHAQAPKTIHEIKCINKKEKLDDDVEWAMFFVKTCLEVDELLRTLASASTSAWKGFGPLKLHLLDSEHSNGRSDVFGNIWLESGRFNRVSLIHELFHITMWRVYRQDPANLTTYGGDFPGHTTSDETDEVFALTEAWPELWAAAFDEHKGYRNERIAKKNPGIVYYQLRTSQPSVYNVANITTSPNTVFFKTFANLAANEGEKVEGVVANSMLEILWKEVVGVSNDADCSVPQRTFSNSAAADKTNDTKYKNWLTDLGTQKRFADMLWLPLVDLGKIVDFYVKKGQLPGHEPTVSDYLFNVLSRIPDVVERTAIRQKFQANFMTQNPTSLPTIDSFYQMKDPDTGTVNVEILGTNFGVDSTVNSGAIPVTMFGCSRTRILVAIPAAATGTTTTITVQTPSGSASKVLTYE